jgi:uroporphyrin-III C-methyltransferase/precorrin-2 dehydrogenase/sirohydrochlorin ferrochelatase
MENKTIPILLVNQKILLIGGGKVALQKAEVLKDNNISFRIVGKLLTNKILELSQNIEQKSFSLKDIKDEYIIIDATGNSEVTSKLLEYKKLTI